jgi:hypothetical protein
MAPPLKSKWNPFQNPYHVSRILPLPLAQAKNGDKQFWRAKFHAPNGKAQHALMMGLVFPFWWWGRGDYCFFFFFFLILNLTL